MPSNVNSFPPAPSVPPTELESRIGRVREEMAKDDIDFIVLTDRNNIEYFTDYRTLSWAYNARPIFAVLSQADIILVASKIESRNISTSDRKFLPMYYDGFLADAARKVVDVISSRHSKNGALGAIDYGQDMFGRGSLDLINGLQNLGLRGQVSSASDLIWRVRMIKTPFEANLKRTAFEIVNSAFDEVIGEVQLGITEIELVRLIQSRIFLKGADRADPIAMIFDRGEFVYTRPPRPKPLELGHYIWTDFRSTYGGYPADRNRIARAGPPEDGEIDTYTKTRGLTLTLASSIRPGMTCGDVYTHFEQLWNDNDLGPIYSLASRIGHGGGLDVTEPPSILRGSSELIVEGMILHIEPKLEVEGAVFQFEVAVYVGRDGNDFLSGHTPEKIPVIQ